MRRVLALWGAAAVLLAPALGAQTVRFGVHGVAMTHGEIDERLNATGFGAGGLLGVRVGRFGLEARGHWARLDPDAENVASYDVVQADVRASILVARSIAFEVGGGRRWIDPDFAAQEVGLFRVGILSEYQLTRIATIWARGAYLPAPQFSGGGKADLAVELSLGTAVGTPNGRFRLTGEYEFQRFDREVRGRGVPIQVTTARLGILLGW